MNTRATTLHLAYALWGGLLVFLYQRVIGEPLTVASVVIPVGVAVGYFLCAAAWKVDPSQVASTGWTRAALAFLLGVTFYLAITAFSGQWVIGVAVGIIGAVVWYLRSTISARRNPKDTALRHAAQS